MNKLKCLAVAMVIFFVSIPVSVSAKSTNRGVPPITTRAEERAEAKSLLVRLYTIKAMDKHDLNAQEKSKLGQEVMDIKNRMQTLGGGVYISVGAVIVILLLVLILL